MSDDKTKLVAIPSPVGGLAKPLASPDELIKYHQEIGSLITKALEKGRDYGPIPGTKGAKNNLLKPGAERVCTAFGVSPEFEITEQEVDHDRQTKWTKPKWNKSGTSFGRYRYVVKCRLVGRSDGRLFGEGVGSCSSLESQYIESPRDSENTVLKMAKKRAFVDATLTAFSLSDRFTQDMEDKPVRPTGKSGDVAAAGEGSSKSSVMYTATETQKEHLFDEALKYGAVRQDQDDLIAISHHCMRKPISDVAGIVKQWYEDKKKGKTNG